MIAKLHFIDGEIVELSKILSESLLEIIEKPHGQSIQVITLLDGNTSYCMWSVKKIEWLNVDSIR